MFDSIKNLFNRDIKSTKNCRSDNMFLHNMLAVSNGILRPIDAIDMYLNVAPVADAVNMITDEVKHILPLLFNTKTNEFIDEHPILDLLDNPNTNMNYSSFIEIFCMYLYVTGNNFMVATGPENRPPLELFIIPPQDISITPSSIDGGAQSYMASGGGTYSRPESALDKSRYRFFLDNQSGIRTSELWHSKIASPISSFGAFGGQSNSLFGLSPLTPHQYNLQLYIECNIHNISVLKRGGLPSLIMNLKNTVDDDQYQRLTEQLEHFHSGSNNAGRKMIVEGSEIEIQELKSDAKDMDFQNLQKMVTQDLFRAYKIPPAMVAEEAMKFNNYKESKVSFYESSVLKKLDKIFSELTQFLMHRYPNSENLVLTYNRNAIPELEPERMDNLKTQSELGILSINEMRKELQLRSIVGGDDVYVNSNQIPVADASSETKIPDESFT